MSQPNVFDEGKSLNPEFDFKFVGWKNVGDKYQGAYAGIARNIDKYNNPQIIYLLKQENGELIGVPFRESKVQIHDLMKDVQIGQYIGFKYTKDFPTKKGNPAKIIEVITTDKFDDTLKGKQGIDSRQVTAPDTEEEEDGINVSNVMADINSTPKEESTTSTPEDITSMLERMSTLAKEKLGAQNAEEAKTKVEEYTHLVINKENLPTIINVLTLAK